MQKLPFVKYTSCGNNFVILDQIHRTDLSEQQLSEFAFKATNVNFGVGCDNLLVIQRCTPATLKRINRQRRYWPQQLPDAEHADFVFRMFEPDGSEALCCGNGLMCIAAYLHHHHHIQQSRIMTEIPLSTPRQCQIGYDLPTPVPSLSDKALKADAAIATGAMFEQAEAPWYWVNIGEPRSMPASLVKARQLGLSCEDHITPVSLDCSHFARKQNLPEGFHIEGYLSFTGEPHLVCFLRDQSAAFLRFLESSPDDAGWLEPLGHFINHRYRSAFPEGININFAEPPEAEACPISSGSTLAIKNRCYERGVYKETLACGTGAMAVASCYQQVYQVQLQQLNILPLRCQLFDEAACIRVHQRADGWYLSTQPRQLLEGLYHLQHPREHSVRRLSPATEREPKAARVHACERIRPPHNARKALA